LNEEITQESITSELTTSLIGRKIYYYPQVGSTMEIAREKALKGAIEGTLVITDEQVAGRGRLGRIWQSPLGSIALSVILYPEIFHLPQLNMLASLAVVNAIKGIAGVEANIKWPNDVLIKGKKVCGIIVESEIKNKRILYAIIGIGINVNLEVGCLGEMPLPATSLADEYGRHLSRLELIRELLVEIERLYLSLKQDNDDVFRRWRDNLETLGRRVEVHDGDNIYKGVAEKVAEDGRLCLRLTDGSLKKVTAGDVTLQNYC
jgi:BirA family biotin operon repressor/biotin-[acetyl-CoA-carboxylase] ligase